MGINEYQESFYLEGPRANIFEGIKSWIFKNQFVIEKEINDRYIRSRKGSSMGLTDKGTKRFLEIDLKPQATGTHISIHEKVDRGFMVGKLIKEEVLNLADFLKTKFIGAKSTDSSHPTDLSFKYCIYCGTKIPSIAQFCEKYDLTFGD